MVKPLKSTIAITLPHEGQNYVLNPSGEIDGNFGEHGGGGVTRSTLFQKYGLYSYHVNLASVGEGGEWELLTLDGRGYYVTVRVRWATSIMDEWEFLINGVSKSPVLLDQIDGNWKLYGAYYPPGSVTGSSLLEINQTTNNFGGVQMYADGIQVEPVEGDIKPSTYMDGTQEGARWQGAPHASASVRSGDSRAGGMVTSFWEGFNFFPEKALGMGTAVEELNIDSYAFLPGGELNSSKIPPREFTIIGYFLADTVEELHEHAQRLELELGLNTYPGRQPVRLRYSGARVLKEISANYTGGLEGDLPIFYNDDWSQEDEAWVRNYKFKMRASVSFVALDPFWYEVGESSTLLDTNDTDTFRYIVGRLADTGQWSNLGVTSDPTSGANVLTIAISPFDGKIYIGGGFVGWNGVAGRDYIAAYDPVNGTWETVGGASDFNGGIFALAFGPDGTLYAGGSFTNVAGNANADIVAQKPPGGGWTNLGAPAATGPVRCITIAPNGDVYIGGDFTNFAGIADADRIVYWDISAGAYAAVIAGASDDIHSIVWLPDMSLAYFGGKFANWGDANGDGIVSWDGSALASLSTGAGGATPFVFSLALLPNGTLYIGGVMETLGGITVNGIGSWNGSSFQALGTGISGGADDVENLTLGPDGLLYLVGQFASAGGLDIAQSAARWNGYTYAHLDIDLPGAAGSTVVWTVAVGPPDPLIKSKYDIFLGFDTSDVGSMAGLVVAENEGTISAFPKIVFNRSGGDEAIIQTLHNERTGRELLFNYALLDGETLTIDLNPKNRTITSSFFGPRMSARLPNDDFSVWQLLPGENSVSSFVSEGGSPTVTGYVIFREPFKSWN